MSSSSPEILYPSTQKNLILVPGTIILEDILKPPLAGALRSGQVTVMQEYFWLFGLVYQHVRYSSPDGICERTLCFQHARTCFGALAVLGAEVYSYWRSQGDKGALALQTKTNSWIFVNQHKVVYFGADIFNLKILLSFKIGTPSRMKFSYKNRIISRKFPEPSWTAFSTIRERCIPCIDWGFWGPKGWFILGVRSLHAGNIMYLHCSVGHFCVRRHEGTRDSTNMRFREVRCQKDRRRSNPHPK